MSISKKCTIRGCGRVVFARAICRQHYRRLRETGSAQEDVPIVTPTRSGTYKKCKIDGCRGGGRKNPKRGTITYSLGYCNAHYLRYRRHGNPLGGERSRESHGMHKTTEYTIWVSMVQRCTNPKDDNYPYYGGRGIKVCDRWRNSFNSFYEDMGDRPSNLTLDRINTNGDYEPSNCRWASRSTQSLNTRVRRNNKTGVKGVWQTKRSNKYEASIRAGGKKTVLGYYSNIEDAIAVRFMAESIYYDM